MNTPKQGSRFHASTAANDGGVARGLARLAMRSTPPLMAHARTVLARKTLFAGVAAATFVPLAAWVMTMTPIYRATSTVLVEAARAKAVAIDEVYGTASGNREYFQTQAEFLKSRDVAARVVRDLRLDEHPAFDPRQRPPGLVAQLKALVPGLPAPRVPSDEEVEAQAVSRVQIDLDVSPVRMSQLIQVSFESPDPTLARDVANATAEAYIRAELDARLRMTQTAVNWLNGQLDSLRQKVDASERKLQAYRDATGLVGSRAAPDAGNAKQLEEVTQRLVQARIEREQLEQVVGQLGSGAPGRFEVPAVFNNASVARAREAEAVAERKLAELKDRVGPAHPQYAAAQSELEAAQRDTRRQAEAVIASLRKQFQTARATEQALEASLSRSRGAIRDTTRKEVELEALEREAASDRQLYQTFLARVKETSATSDFRSPVARVIDPAIVPVLPVRPARLPLLALSLLASLALGAAAAIYRERSRMVLKTSDDVERLLDVPLLTAMPVVAAPADPASKGLARARAMLREPGYGEAVRTAVTGVQLALADVQHAVVAVTSSVPGEGKSTFAVAFALEQSRTRRVLLIDADLRRPSVAAMLGMPSKLPGVRELVRGRTVGECIHRIPETQLDVLPSARRSENALDLLAHPRFPQALRELRRYYDLIVIDTPPVELFSDALLIARQADGIAYVARASETPVAMVERGLARLRSADAPLLGVVMNAHDFTRAGRYYGETAAQARYDYATRAAA